MSDQRAKSVMSDYPLEELRQRYKPHKVSVLFVGESPPAKGTFFYKGDSNLAQYTQEAFSEVFGAAFESPESFLEQFRLLGCYLEDLCLTPVNHLSRGERRREQERWIGSLAERIGSLSVKTIVVVMCGIVPYVERAVEQAGLKNVLRYSVPFPAMGHQHQYVRELVKVLQELQELQEAGILPKGICT